MLSRYKKNLMGTSLFYETKYQQHTPKHKKKLPKPKIHKEKLKRDTIIQIESPPYWDIYRYVENQIRTDVELALDVYFWIKLENNLI